MSDKIEKAVFYADQLKELIEAIHNGFEERGKLQKKFARMLFKKSTKLSIDDWLPYSEEISSNMQALRDAAGKIPEKVDLDLAQLRKRLKDLITYHEKTADMVQNFFKGEELDQIQRDLGDARKKLQTFREIIVDLEDQLT